MTVGSKIFELRKKWNMSQEELAERVHVSRQTVSKWENDVVLPDVYNLKELARVFQCTVDELINDTKEVSDEQGVLILEKKDSRETKANNDAPVVEAMKYSGGLIKRHWQKIGYCLIFMSLGWTILGFIVAVSSGSLKIGHKVYHFGHEYENHTEHLFDMNVHGFEGFRKFEIIQTCLWLVPLVVGIVLIVYDRIKMKDAK